MQDAKFRIGIFAAIGLLLVAALVIAHFVGAARQRDCARHDAQVVSTRAGYFCVTKDGRVILP